MAMPAALRPFRYWLNPAAILNGSVLGYLDPLFAAPLVASLISGAMGWPLLAGGLLALSVLTKVQAVLLAPVIALAVWQVGRHGAPGGMGVMGPARAVGGAAAVTVVALSPFAVAGALPNLRQAVMQLTRHDMLSAQAANLWWIVTWILRGAYGVADYGVLGAFTRLVKGPLGMTRVVELGYPNPRVFATLAVLAVFAWVLWRGRRARDLPMLAGMGALMVWAYFTLAVQVHENHAFMAVPLLVLAAAGRRAFSGPLVALSALFTLNLNLFYGLGDRVGYAVPRTITLVDASVVVAVANLAAFIWCARVLSRECAAT